MFHMILLEKGIPSGGSRAGDIANKRPVLSDRRRRFLAKSQVDELGLEGNDIEAHNNNNNNNTNNSSNTTSDGNSNSDNVVQYNMIFNNTT